ncbi:MAG: hypothetical protein KC646_10380 [Candidatus Cloacimonetes bacterium]|nr:hypothetical protein [Candidatus Cloacimonadota bacterium]
MDKSLVATPEYLEKQIKYLGDCFNVTNKKGRVLEIVRKMKGMPLHHAKQIFRKFIDGNDRFPLIKEFNEQINYFENLERETFKRLEQDKSIELVTSMSVHQSLKEAARPMKILLKRDPEKFNQLKDSFNEFFPNILSQSRNHNSAISDTDLRVNACFSMLNEFHLDPVKVFKEEIDKCVPGIRKDRLMSGLSKYKRTIN